MRVLSNGWRARRRAIWIQLRQYGELHGLQRHLRRRGARGVSTVRDGGRVCGTQLLTEGSHHASVKQEAAQQACFVLPRFDSASKRADPPGDCDRQNQCQEYPQAKLHSRHQVTSHTSASTCAEHTWREVGGQASSRAPSVHLHDDITRRTIGNTRCRPPTNRAGAFSRLTTGAVGFA